VQRLASIPLVALLVCSCNGSDTAVGLDGGTETNPAGGATRSTAVTRVDLGTLGGASSYAADINSANTVVGWSETPGGSTHAFRWSAAEGMVDLGTLPGDAMSRAVAVLDGETQNGGQILGVSGDGDRWTSVVWSASGSISILPMMANSTRASPTDFNTRGDVVGSDAVVYEHGWIWSEISGKYDLTANAPGGSYEGFATAITASGLVLLITEDNTCTRAPECWRTYLWSQTTGYQSLGTPAGDPEASIAGLGLNQTGTVAGWLGPGAIVATIPYRWSAVKGFTLLANYSTGSSGNGYALAVNSAGTVVGADREPVSGSVVASTWLADGAIVRLSPDDPNSSVAVAINNPGTIAGWAAVASGANHAVIWQPSSQASGVILRPSTSVSVGGSTPRVSTASSPCLADARSITSRQALFTCVIKADHRR
jgi:probable HAF family extracellular repeat protein